MVSVDPECDHRLKIVNQDARQYHWQKLMHACELRYSRTLSPQSERADLDLTDSEYWIKAGSGIALALDLTDKSTRTDLPDNRPTD